MDTASFTIPASSTCFAPATSPASRLARAWFRISAACWNWGTVYDLLEATPAVAKVVLSHPAKNRIIADAQINNDRVDAKALATLLRGDFVARVHVPAKAVRQKKNTVRQRLWIARLRTMAIPRTAAP